jgi:hypothetical protein
VRQRLTAFCAALGTRLPPLLDAAVTRLEGTGWVEVADTWSGLTPSGFPVEVAVAPGADSLHWAAEVAGPEVPEAQRLGLVAGELAAHGPAVDPTTRAALAAAQDSAKLRFGAWIGGREPAAGPPRLKLYAELPPTTDLTDLGLPEPLVSPCRWLPAGTTVRMLGVEPLRGRTEIYLRLPDCDIHDLASFLHATGHGGAWHGLRTGLPDGLARLTGRRLGVSIACGAAGPPDVALFVSARTLFPTKPAMLAGIAPVATVVDRQPWLAGAVTLGLDPTGRGLPVAVGFYPRGRRRPRRCE